MRLLIGSRKVQLNDWAYGGEKVVAPDWLREMRGDLMMKPTLRDNFRYLLVQCSCAGGDERAVLERELEKLLGMLGLYETGARIVFVQNGEIGVRVLRGQEGKVCAALALSNSQAGKNVRFRVLGVSGTIESLCKKGGVKHKKKRFMAARNGRKR
ncbi:MAG: Rpp14/Pop5 family protein [Candidatus Micrarchaeota archaeon]